MHENPHVARCEDAANELADALQNAFDQGVPPIVLLPALITVFREKGISLDSLPMLQQIAGA